jgi:hypothetical protein
MSHPWTDKLSDYLDQELDAHDREAVERHIATCSACHGTLAELRQVMARAETLEPRMPERDLWAGIADRIGADPAHEVPKVIPFESKRPRWWAPRFTLSAPQLVAAGMLIAVLSSAGVWFAMRGPMTGAGPAGELDPIADMQSSGIDALPVSGYERTIGDLEGTLAQNRSRLDPTTIAILEQNLAIIDAAIADSREALVADPASAYLYRHLNRQMQQKVDLLEQATQYAYASPQEP